MDAEQSLEAVGSAALEAVRRPSGWAQIFGGLVLICIGALLVIIGIFLPAATHPYGLEDLPAEPNGSKWALMWAGSGMFSLGLFLWALGKIIRALFFLPGRSVSSSDLDG